MDLCETVVYLINTIQTVVVMEMNGSVHCCSSAVAFCFISAGQKQQTNGLKYCNNHSYLPFTQQQNETSLNCVILGLFLSV